MSETVTLDELISGRSFLSAAVFQMLGPELPQFGIEPGVTKSLELEMRINGREVSIRSFLAHLESEFDRCAKLEAGMRIKGHIKDMEDALYRAEQTLVSELCKAGLLVDDD